MKLSLKESEIYIENGILNSIEKYCLGVFSPSRIHIVTDSNVEKLYLDFIKNQFSIPVSYTVVPAGEEHKRLSTVEIIYNDLIKNQLTRKDLIIALGGGVIGDTAGFAAATYLRGISLCQVPTTLLAQVDSSVGGKTGVDIEEGKNLIGAFYQPRLVLIDSQVLNTLREETLIDGMGEVIKYGYIKNPKILELCNDYKNNIDEIIYECVKIKRDIVEVDEYDKGLRMTLNFGHTIAHAIEKLGNYKELTHGQAVAIGMVSMMKISAMMGNHDLSEELINLLDKIGLPSKLNYNTEEIYNALFSDKKKFGDTINLILVKEKGVAEINPVDVGDLYQYIIAL